MQPPQSDSDEPSPVDDGVDPEKTSPKPEDFDYYTERPLKAPHSWGGMGEGHWSKNRGERNDEVIDYLRSRGEAPGVEEGGAVRNHYCMNCDGVIPLAYFQMEPADKIERVCPHCGVKLDQRIHRMFNWVEIDQPHDGDLKALLEALWPFFLAAALIIGALLWWLISA